MIAISRRATRAFVALPAGVMGGAMGMRSLSPTPCADLQSSLHTIGNSHAPLTGCPGYTSSP